MVKKLGIGCGALVILVVVIVVVASLASGGNKQPTTADASTQPGASTSAAPAESAKPKDDNVHAPLAANTTAQVEESKNRVHGLTILEVADPATSDNQFDQPTDGNRYWGIKVQVESLGTEAIHTGAWKLRGANDFEYDQKFTTIQPTLNSYTDLTAGGKAAGWVIFELPTDVQPKWLRYDPNMITGKDLYFDAQA